MLHVSRKFEYGLHAVSYLATRGAGRVVTVKEMADDIGFSQEFLSKAMQSLKKAGIIASVQGVKGGYTLAKPLSGITVADIGEAIEGKPHLTRCASDLYCEIASKCTHKQYMNLLQNKIQEFMGATTLETLIEGDDSLPQLK
ncbi:RrF2 family transcriptional regulator [Chlorobium phaeobacteroides]|jgi:Rrf2 family protein|uniref:Transcriptional regulator, BadM/Rrf2 family n=1 Tax=Chlorobium phaeobacteroides (strain DSM 266 / SMG 266 / 2430) TaxID=290317 RepID=A1BHS9_CHLPD|nr:Rrf2 family transcriptional regulator [Chlorobium phaeobacteroides]ABL65956.1 transcriptional regulator, BadM/Rrf2 family [Chlorobium phaeobacteroides DSM 266]MBV5327695.1 Rrf2 family transcriptional regulator [Chlorobium sp.]